MIKIKLLWEQKITEGRVLTSHGTLADEKTVISGSVNEIELTEYSVKPGPFATIVHIQAGEKSFSFFLRDVSAANPIYVPTCGAVVTIGDDTRGYDRIVSDISHRGGKCHLKI